MSRIEDLTPETMTADQRRVYDAILAGPRGRAAGPFHAWLRSPGLAERAQELGAFVRFGTAFPTVLSELAILVTARHWRAEFEWWAHKRIALEAGLDPAIVDAIARGGDPEFSDPDQQLVYEAATEIYESRTLGAETYASMVDRFDEAGVAELIGVLGYYAMVSMTLNVFDVNLPKGEEPVFSNA